MYFYMASGWRMECPAWHGKEAANEEPARTMVEATFMQVTIATMNIGSGWWRLPIVLASRCPGLENKQEGESKRTQLKWGSSHSVDNSDSHQPLGINPGYTGSGWLTIDSRQLRAAQAKAASAQPQGMDGKFWMPVLGTYVHCIYRCRTQIVQYLG